MIGQCGITMQEYKNKKVPEIGYRFSKGFLASRVCSGNSSRM